MSNDEITVFNGLTVIVIGGADSPVTIAGGPVRDETVIIKGKPVALE